MTKYAEGTKITPEKSQVEVQTILKKYGATDVASGEQGEQAVIGFKFNGKLYKIILPYPDIKDFLLSGNRTRTGLQQQTAKDQEIRRLWRALILVIKAKLEAAQSGIVTFEQEFMAHIVVNEQGQTMYEWAKPFLDSNKLLQLPPIREDV